MLSPAYLVGLDLGQVNDPTALAIMEIQFNVGLQHLYLARHLQRFELGTPYPDIVEQVGALLTKLPRPLAWREEMRRLQALRSRQPVPPLYRLIIDNTGVGRPIGDMFARLAPRPVRVTLTTGHMVSQHEQDEFTVPKRDVVCAFQLVIESRRFKTPRSSPEASTLVKEALNFEYKLSTKTGDDTYGAWREGTHDDLLLAAAMAIWYGERNTPPPPRQVRISRAALLPHTHRTRV